jgi:DNA processing protein
LTYAITDKIPALESMKTYPTTLFYRGDLRLLKRPKVSIVGTRRPSNYTRQFTYTLAKALAKRGVCVVSGVAMGVDAIAHEGAGMENTIAVVANGLDIAYPSVNKNLIRGIEKQGLVMSQFQDGFTPTNWSFVLRNEVVVALGDLLIVSEADMNSGSMRSVAFAQKMGKEIFVLPHRMNESLGTNALLAKNKATAIYDIESFVARFGIEADEGIEKDDFFYFCQTSPTFDALLEAFGERVYEAEFEGIITIRDGIVRLV